ncbi:MAG: hypothetical protein IKT29_06655 [Flavobacteriales bacterium]|nr:hypothetical protein [Flavobacteriales bacterium]
MKVFTLRFRQFIVVALLLTVIFRYVLNLSIGEESLSMVILCAFIYFCMMFICGWYFGKKDATENGFYDIGFRYHAATYVICVGISYVAYYVGLNTESLWPMTITALSWGIGLLVHLILFLIEQRKTIKGYAKDEIFD